MGADHGGQAARLPDCTRRRPGPCLTDASPEDALFSSLRLRNLRNLHGAKGIATNGVFFHLSHLLSILSQSVDLLEHKIGILSIDCVLDNHFDHLRLPKEGSLSLNDLIPSSLKGGKDR